MTALVIVLVVLVYIVMSAIPGDEYACSKVGGTCQDTCGENYIHLSDGDVACQLGGAQQVCCKLGTG